LGRLEENDRMCESIQKHLDKVIEDREKFGATLNMRINTVLWIDVIGLLSDISKSLAVIANKEDE